VADTFLTFIAACVEILFEHQSRVIDAMFTEIITVFCFRAGLIL
jgi:hypothetical protein